MAVLAPTMPPDEILADEDRTRGRVAIATWIAAATTLAGAIISAIAFNGLPSYDDRVVTITDALGNLATGTPIPQGRAALQLIYIGDHPLPFAIGPLLSGIGGLLIFVTLSYLYRASQRRSGQPGRIAIVATAVGAVSYGLGTALVGVLRVVEGTGLDATATNSDALDAVGSGPIVIGTILQLLGSLTLGFAFVLMSLHAMRAGLLTRFMGILGMIAGATFVLPLDQQGIIRSFWLGAAGFIIARRWPTPIPAWQTGRAEPWPSGRGGRATRGGDPAPAPQTPAPTLPAPNDGLTQGQRRKKRKK